MNSVDLRPTFWIVYELDSNSKAPNPDINSIRGIDETMRGIRSILRLNDQLEVHSI